MEGEDGSDEGGDPGGGASEFTQEPPGLEGGHGLFDEGTDLRVGPVDRLLIGGQGVPAPSVRSADGAVGAAVAIVRRAGDVGSGEGVDDAVFAGRADVVDGPRQGW